MKTTRTNSFRLHRVNKTGSVRKSSQTFYDPDQSFKLAALNSVTQGVKHADISFLTGNDLKKLRVEPLEANEGEYNSAHHNLSEVRRKYDEMKKERVALEERIHHEKAEIEKLSIFKGEYEDKIGEAKSKAAILKQQLESKKNLLELTVTEKKVLLSMEARHQSDKVYFDQRKFNAEQELSFLTKQLAIFKKEGHSIGQSEDRTSKVYEKLGRELQMEREEREAHIKNLEDMIEEKLLLVNSNQAREVDLYEIAERAIQDKDLSEKNWRKIFLTHIFVNRMLRNKIEKEMEKFKVVEMAFKEIKTCTGVNDALNLVKKYLNKEAVYGELLGKIADNEKTIEHLKNQTEDLHHESKSLQSQLEVLHSIKIKSQDLHDSIKELQQFDDKASRAETLQNKSGQWAVRQLKKLSVMDKKQQEQQVPKSTHQLASVFTKLLNFLKRESQLFPSSLEFPKEEGGLGSKESERNTRIVAKRSRRNSGGEEIFDVDEQETLPSSQIQEQEVINSQREELLRNNEKFMREVRRKREEERRLFVDKNEAKKEKPIMPKAESPHKD